MTEIKQKKVHEERESQEQRHWNIVQLQNIWLVVGIVLLGLGIAVVSLSQQNWVAVVVLCIVGLLICAFSRQIASIMVKAELKRIQNNIDANTRRIVMPNSIKNLATAAAWVLFVLGCISLACGIIYVVLIGFNILSVTSSEMFPLLYVGFGILCLILAYLASWIRSKIE